MAFELVEEQGLRTNGDYGLNWGGMQEKWLQGDTGSGWFFLLPDGTLNQWNDSFENSIQLAELGTEYYDAPTLLLNAESLDLEYSIEGNVLTVTSGLQTGTFNFTASASDGAESVNSIFDVVIADRVLKIDVADQNIESGSAAVFNLPTINPRNGLEIVYEFSIVDLLYALDQEHGFYASGDFDTNYLGNNERWIRDANDEWHYLLPNGDLYRWEDSFETSPLLAELDSEVYDDPSLLTNAQPIAVVFEYANGQLTVTPPPSFVGQLQLRIEAPDRSDTITEIVQIEVIDAASSLDSAFTNWNQLAH